MESKWKVKLGPFKVWQFGVDTIVGMIPGEGRSLLFDVGVGSQPFFFFFFFFLIINPSLPFMRMLICRRGRRVHGRWAPLRQCREWSNNSVSECPWAKTFVGKTFVGYRTIFAFVVVFMIFHLILFLPSARQDAGPAPLAPIGHPHQLRCGHQ